MANRFIGGVLSSRPQANTPFSSRASTGTYFDSAGVMRTAPVNQPRLNYSLVGGAWTQPAVLIEPASTNALVYSQDFSNTWVLQYSVLTANSITAPDGTVTASTISNDTSGNYHRFYQPLNSFTQRTSYSFSVFLKYKDHQYVSIGLTDNSYYRSQIVVNLVAGTIAQNYIDAYSPSDTLISTITSVGNGWYRLTGVYTPAIAIVTNLYWLGLLQQNSTFSSGGYVGTGTGFYMWGAQAEVNLLGATSYIPTTSAAVTRAADVVGPYSTGIFNLSDRQNTTAVDDQSTVQSFTSTGNTTWTAPLDVTSVEVLVVAGGGAGGGGSGAIGGGGGGAGGIIYNTSYPVTPGVTYPVIVGAGGVGANRVKGTNGSNSQFGALVALGGGAGASDGSISNVGTPGGSGGGGGGRSGIGAPGTAGQGNSGSNGATSAYYAGGAGGGAGGPATPFFGSVAGSGGPGLYFNISGTSTAYGGGGGGGGSSYSSVSTAGSGGIGGGGAGTSTSINGNPGTANTGGGGGASGWSTDSGAILGGNGGSGIVIVKYKRTPRQLASTSNAALVVQKFSTTNLWTVPVGVTQVEALVVAGGGAGGYDRGGGGGAGGLSYSSALTVTPGSTYTIGVGAGGIGGTAYRNNNGQSQSGFGSGIGTGTELITNGSAFTTTTGWSATTATLSVPQTGTFRILPNASVNGSASQTITTVIGTTYVVVVKVTSDTAKQFRLFVGSSQFGQQNASFFTAYTRDSLDNGASGAGFYSVTFTASATTTWIDLQIGGGTQQATDISYISVRQATLPTIGGGYGGDGAGAAASGGSGGGTGSGAVSSGGAGTAGQGNSGGANGGSTNNGGAGGGGGAGSSGSNGGYGTGTGGSGGAGLPYSITGNLEYYAGGGGGGAAQDFAAPKISGYGGIGGGGQGGNANADPGKPGAPNTGGGGGGGSNIAQGAGGNGGSGVVVLRYRVPQIAVFQDSGAWSCPSGVTSVQALIVAGGGGGGAGSTASQLGGGGGGAGGLIYDNSIPVSPGQTYSVVVGQGGIGGVTGTSVGSNGQNSSFSNLIAIGGGYGALRQVSENGSAGGSGGGGAGGAGAVGGSGTYGQGNSGATTAGGGGGAGSPGVYGQSSTEPTGGAGGAGLQFSISGTATYYAGGGASGAWGGATINPGSLGGGGSGGPSRNNGFVGAQNTGGGGGGSGSGYRNSSLDTAATGNGAHGGSGIVILRWSGA